MSKRHYCSENSIDPENGVGKAITDKTIIAPPSLKRRAVDFSPEPDDVQRNIKRSRTDSSEGTSPDGDFIRTTTSVPVPELNCGAQSKRSTHDGVPSFQVGQTDTLPTLGLQPCNVIEEEPLLTAGVKIETMFMKGGRTETGPTLKHSVDPPSLPAGEQTEDLVPDDAATSSETGPQTTLSRAPCLDDTKKPLLLPLELHEYILEFFWDDREVTYVGGGKDVTRKCREVCSRWYAAARPHLFRVIVIASEKRLTGLTSLIRQDPNIAQWIRKFMLRGVTRPLHPTGARQPDDAEEDRNKWLYPFPLCFDAPLPSVKLLDLDLFANVSRRPEDCRAFVRWVRDLSIMTSIDRIHFDNCKMSSNSAIALIRAFPHLKTLKFRGVDFTRPNIGVLVDTSLEPTHLDSSYTIAPNTTETRVSSGSNSLLEEPVRYPLLHPPPRLQSIDAINYTDFQPFDFDILRPCLCPKALSESLRALRIGYHVDLKSVSTFIAGLGTSSTIENLRLHVGQHRHSFIDCNIDISHLTNLRELTLLGDLTSTDEISLNSRRLLSQVDATHLKSVRFIIPFKEHLIQQQLVGVDDDLAQEKFKNLETISVNLLSGIFEVVDPKKRWSLFQPFIPKVQKIFPLAEKRKVLNIIDMFAPR